LIAIRKSYRSSAAGRSPDDSNIFDHGFWHHTSLVPRATATPQRHSRFD
jgi:hypothetical protein